MQHPSNSKDSPNHKSPSSSPQRPPSGDPTTPNPTQAAGGGEGGGIKIPWQMMEICGSGGEGSGEGGDSSGGRVSDAAVAGGGAVGVVKGVDPNGGTGVGSKRKRKASDVTDPPSGTPKCEVCLREFASWKAAFGHMRAHPHRQYRGFFKPPDFSSSASSSSSSTAPAQEVPGPAHQAQAAVTGGDGGGDEGAGPSVPKEGRFDLNKPTEGVEVGAEVQKNDIEENNRDFDLNELPPPADEDDNDKP